ncbi:MAG: hypothetical protein KTR32_34790 [Granulosicoccus sp.]|nr:hypothetical protein [Granulosicoccus sp.]
MSEGNNAVLDREEQESKDEFFERVAKVANEMIESHGKDFAMGTLVLAARFIADGKPITGMKTSE